MRFSIRKLTFSYLLLFVTSGLAIYLVARFGDLIFPLAVTTPSHIFELAAKSDQLFSTLCSLLVVIIVTRLVGTIFKRMGQPRVIGEVIGGILLGPSVFGALAHHWSDIVLPATSIPFLAMVSQIGVLLFMFLIGLELDLSNLKRSGRAALLISHASIVVPFLLGMGVAFLLFNRLAPLGVGFSSFALFIGVSMSVTAFPVLARILSDSGLQKTPLGTLALTCAAIDDATAWCLLALVVGLLQSAVGSALITMALTVAYIIVMFFGVRPLLHRLVPLLEQSSDRISETSLAFVLIALLVSAVSTELIGIHALFGGFLLGAIIPHQSLLAKDLTSRLSDLVQVFFLPAFFAFTGMRTQIGLMDSSYDWMVCLGLIAVATTGKFGGAFLAAKLSGLTTRTSAILGVLMNTRGLVGLIVLNAGLDLGVLSPQLFTMLVIMAVVTTLMTGPLLKILRPNTVADLSAKTLTFPAQNSPFAGS